MQKAAVWNSFHTAAAVLFDKNGLLSYALQELLILGPFYLCDAHSGHCLFSTPLHVPHERTDRINTLILNQLFNSSAHIRRSLIAPPK